MREYAEEIQSHDVELLAVCPADSAGIRQFLDAYGPYPFELMGDPELTTYRSLRHVRLSPLVSYLKAIQLLLTGQAKDLIPKDPAQLDLVRQAIKHQDVHIQGGAWLFDVTGRVLWKHIDKDAANHATIEQILEQIRKSS